MSNQGSTAQRAKLIYKCEKQLWPVELRELFIELQLDPETQTFIRQCEEDTLSLTSLYLKPFLGMFVSPFLSRTGYNGLMGRGYMHVLSKNQFRTLLTGAGVQEKGGSLLDIGAGDGNVTEKIAPMFNDVTATEVSPVMAWRLRQRGFKVATADTLDHPDLAGQTYDVVSLLNVLDRCHYPWGLLNAIKGKLKPGTGKLVIAVVLPFHPSVETSEGWVAAKEFQERSSQLPPEPDTYGPWEHWVTWLHESFFRPTGYSITRFTRTPYISAGDAAQPFYVLQDAVFVLEQTP